jgi:hypothetical protein
MENCSNTIETSKKLDTILVSMGSWIVLVLRPEIHHIMVPLDHAAFDPTTFLHRSNDVEIPPSL